MGKTLRGRLELAAAELVIPQELSYDGLVDRKAYLGVLGRSLAGLDRLLSCLEDGPVHMYSERLQIILQYAFLVTRDEMDLVQNGLEDTHDFDARCKDLNERAYPLAEGTVEAVELSSFCEGS